ncbi:uncharacterized protein UHO2_01744 [Ustilago hordei]|uniref:uncharacterized protein n=1 Tax=Ustilago hordei TaxID=120017 RepID=UPI001A62B7A8|nr:uncharacterized protein UHO2_01744 [Ustilago hordei]SYW85500.1 uncharacterized protein UHO2_01744 [Ustilago hordei]
MGYTRHNHPPPPSNKFRIVGSPIHIPAYDKKIMTNLTVIDSDTNQLILQRFKPMSYKKQTAANKSAPKGLELFMKALQKHDQMKSRGNIHLGLWAERGNVKINFTTHTSKNEFGVKLLEWAQDHSNEHLNHLVPLLHPQWQHNLKNRPKTKLLPNYWTSCSFFNTFTGEIHNNTGDSVPSFLFNFGISTMVRIIPYGIDVQVDHLVVLVLNTSFDHMTWDAEVDAEGIGVRWAFSAFIRKVIDEQRASPSALSGAKGERKEGGHGEVDTMAPRYIYTPPS